MVKVPRLRIRPEYLDVKEITGAVAGNDTWSDEATINGASYRLERLSNEKMLREVKIFFTGLTKTQSPRAIASALILTWNLRNVDRVETCVFPEVDEGADPADIPIKLLEEEGTEYVDEEISRMVDEVNGFEARRAGAYTAASTLKMFSKSFDSWIQAWEGTKDHLKTRYKDFCKREYPFKNLKVVHANVEKMHGSYQGPRLYLGTLGRILYSLANVEDGRQTAMLFEQHLSCSRMHIIPLFVNAQISLGCSMSDLLSALDYGQNRPTLLQLFKAIHESLKPISKENRATWRFSGLLSSGAFPLLQTIYCLDTVAVLAQINKLLKKPSSLSDPLNIAVLRRLSQERMTRLKGTAKLIYRHFMVSKQETGVPVP